MDLPCLTVVRSGLPPRRAINVPLPRWNQYPGGTIVVLLVRALLGTDVGVYRVRDRGIGTARLVLVDHGGPFAVMTHPRHEVLETCAAGRCERVPGMP